MLDFDPLIQDGNHSLKALPILVERCTSLCNVSDELLVKPLIEVLVNFGCLEKGPFDPLGFGIVILSLPLHIHPFTISLSLLLLKLLENSKTGQKDKETTFGFANIFKP